MNIQEIQTDNLTSEQGSKKFVNGTNFHQTEQGMWTDKEKRRESVLNARVTPDQSSNLVKDKPKVIESTAEASSEYHAEEDPDWNTKFQKAVAKVTKLFEIGTADQTAMISSVDNKIHAKTQNYLRNSNEDLYSSRKTKILKSYSKLADLYGNFIDTATWYGKIIISERYLPKHQKTIKPNEDLGGIAGGLKYVVHNIIFKFSTDHIGLYNSDHNAQKLASHELKGLIHLFNHGTKVGLCCPMMTVIDYKGFRLIAMSKLPVKGNTTLVYGSRDAGATILNDATFCEKLKPICRELGLKPHKVKPAVAGSFRSSTDNIFSHPQLKAMKPANPEPSEVITMFTPVDLEGHKGNDGRLYLLDFSRLFPPELPDRSVKCSHLFRLLRPEFVKFYAKKYGPLSPDAFSSFAKDTDTATEDNEEIAKATKYLLEDQIAKCIKELETFVSIDPFAFVEAFHRNGINLRHLGNARRYLYLDGAPLSEHQEKWSKLFLIEMIARTIKNELGHLMRYHVDNQKVPGDQELKHRVAQYLSTIFGASPKAANYWMHTIKDKIVTYFPNALTQEEQDSTRFCESIKSTDLWLLMKRTLCLSGVRLTSEAAERFQKPDQLAFDNPVDETDIEAIVERVKNMSLAAYAKAYTFQMKAVHARNEKEAKRFYQMALQKFKTALAMEPDHIDSLLQIFDAVVFLGYNNVAQSLYNTLSSIDPRNFLFLYKYALFCEKVKWYDKAEENYLASLEENPNYILCLISYAKFISDVYKDYDTAERFYKRALQNCPRNCYVLFNYAIFLQQKRGELREAEEYFLKALALPHFESLDEILLLKDYASFLREQASAVPIADKYQKQFTDMKNEWERKNQTDVEYPNFKTVKPTVTTTDYGYVTY